MCDWPSAGARTLARNWTSTGENHASVSASRAVASARIAAHMRSRGVSAPARSRRAALRATCGLLEALQPRASQVGVGDREGVRLPGVAVRAFLDDLDGVAEQI